MACDILVHNTLFPVWTFSTVSMYNPFLINGFPRHVYPRLWAVPSQRPRFEVDSVSFGVILVIDPISTIRLWIEIGRILEGTLEP
jgi:hypothetical protein